jgi:hypothetical protein
METEIGEAKREFYNKVKPAIEKRNQALREAPSFWYNALRGHNELAPFFDDNETCEAMQNCVDIEFLDLPPADAGFTLRLVCHLPFFVLFLDFSYDRLFWKTTSSKRLISRRHIKTSTRRSLLLAERK